MRCDLIFKREALVKFKNEDIVMKDWSIDLFANFLYNEYPGRPTNEKATKPSILDDYTDPIMDTVLWALPDREGDWVIKLWIFLCFARLADGENIECAIDLGRVVPVRYFRYSCESVFAVYFVLIRYRAFPHRKITAGQCVLIIWIIKKG